MRLPTRLHVRSVRQSRVSGGPHHKRTRQGGEQRGIMVKAAKPEEAATGAFPQVIARAGAKCLQLPKLRARVDSRHTLNDEGPGQQHGPQSNGGAVDVLRLSTGTRAAARHLGYVPSPT